jgi:hypothetical protein
VIDPTALPMSYDEFPELGDLGVRHAWNVRRRGIAVAII